MKSIVIRIVLLLVAGATPSRAALQFTRVEPVGLSQALRSVAYDSSSVFLAVGADSTVVSASSAPSQGTNWSSRRVASGDVSLNAVVWGAGTFLAAGTAHQFFASSDGTNWQAAPNAPIPAEAVADLAFNPGNGAFAAVMNSFRQLWSSDPRAGWTRGTNVAPDGSQNGDPFVQFLRGVTPFAADGFVAVGVNADIRISTNGGMTWVGELTAANVSSGTNFLDVAWNGEQTLVAVGTNTASQAVICRSTDGGATWSATPSIPAGVQELNAVAHIGPGDGFIAAGRGGVILTSADGDSWKAEESPTTENLYDIAVARDGQFAGLIVLVGDNGTIVLAANPPEAPGNAVHRTIYAGFEPEEPLQVTPPAGAVVDWYDAPVGGTLQAGATNALPLPEQVGNISSTNVFYAESRDERTGFVSASRTPVACTVIARPTALLLTGDQTGCNNGEAFELKADLTGDGPWQVTWSDGVVTEAQASPVSRVVYPTNTLSNAATHHLFSITNLLDARLNTLDGRLFPNLEGDLQGASQITINPRPGAIVTGGGMTCPGEGVAIEVALTGIGPWQFEWTADGVAFLTNIVTDSTAALIVNPTVTTVYAIANLVDQGSNCPADPDDLAGAAQVIVDQEGPVAVCREVTLQLSANGEAFLTPEEADGGSHDNCGIISTNLSRARFTADDIGTNLAELTVVDAAGNESTCMVTVVVVPYVPPTLSISNTAEGIVITWVGPFTLQSATNLAEPEWTSELTGIAGMTNRWTNSAPKVQQYFRLVDSPPALPEQ